MDTGACVRAHLKPIGHLNLRKRRRWFGQNAASTGFTTGGAVQLEWGDGTHEPGSHVIFGVVNFETLTDFERYPTLPIGKARALEPYGPE